MRAFAFLSAVVGWQVGPGSVRAPAGRPLRPALAPPLPAGFQRQPCFGPPAPAGPPAAGRWAACAALALAAARPLMKAAPDGAVASAALPARLVAKMTGVEALEQAQADSASPRAQKSAKNNVVFLLDLHSLALQHAPQSATSFAGFTRANPATSRAGTRMRATNTNVEPEAFFEPRDYISIGYLTFGACFTAINVTGRYEHYEQVLCVALVLGTLSTAAMINDAIAPQPLPTIDGPGYMNRATCIRFGAAYALAAMFVCWRTGPFYPVGDDASPLLVACDPLLNLAAAATFGYGLVAPIASWTSPADRAALTPLRALLLKSSVVQNVIGATFLPVVLTMAARGSAWWQAVHELWPYQQLLEPSTSTFACLCADAGLLALRLAARGKLSWQQVVNVGVTTTVVLAVVPCAAFLRYNDGLFDWFSLYALEL